MHVQHFSDGPSKPDTCFGEPDGLQVTANQVLVCQVDCGRSHAAGHHPGGVGEKILIVRRPGRAVGDHERGLAAASGTSAALRVVGGRGRHVAHVHRVEHRDVNAKLHRRGTEEDRQATGFCPFAEPSLAFFPNRRIDLRGVFTCLRAVQKTVVSGQQLRHGGVEGAEERVHAAMVRGGRWPAVLRRCPALCRWRRRPTPTAEPSFPPGTLCGPRAALSAPTSPYTARTSSTSSMTALYTASSNFAG